jgi:pseudouridine-5'-phosphate glycosidase
MITDRLTIGPEVAAALADGRPVVALESTLISHGLPYPQNLEVAAASEAAVRAEGAVPATVAIHDGRLLVGLDEAALLALATAPVDSIRKAARPSLAAALADGGWAATTVSATMIAAHAAGISVFATGGIGGVHRGALDGGGGRGGGSGGLGGGSGAFGGAVDPVRRVGSGGLAATFDISSDLEELGRTPMAVVCAGPKAILDVPATLEYLETRGVPVLAIGQAELPGFFARSAGIPAPDSAPDVATAARLVSTHLGLGLGSGILVCVPVPAADALPDEVAREAVAQAIAAADAAGIGGPALTPWLLARIAEITGGASVRANTALIVNDARVAGSLAVRLYDG